MSVVVSSGEQFGILFENSTSLFSALKGRLEDGDVDYTAYRDAVSCTLNTRRQDSSADM